MTDHNEVLCHLIDVCEDAQKFYLAAAHETKDDYIESVFTSLARIRGNIIVDLSDFMAVTGSKNQNIEAAKSKANYLFFDLRSKVGQRDLETDVHLISRLEEAEDIALQEFYKALAQNIPLATKAVLSQQIGTLKETVDFMKTLKINLAHVA